MTKQMINQEMREIRAELFIEVAIYLTATLQVREATTEEIIAYIRMNDLV